MSSSHSLRRAIHSALLAQAALLACTIGMPAHAADDEIVEVVVTGSRIARPEVESSVPVQIISGDVIQSQGAPNVADILAEIPAVGTPEFSRTNSNFATISNGISTISLRNMGDQRTLVLINGRRVVSGAGGTSTVDLNNIPTDLIESVQVLTGGASAVYGSEAIAGVVNFILKDDFEGLHFRGQTGASSEQDSERHLFSVTGGLNIGDRGNVTANGQYDRDVGLRSRDRAISAYDNPDRSSYTPQGLFLTDDSVWTYRGNTLQNDFDLPVDGYNRNGDRYIAVPLERTLMTVLGHYELSDRVEGYFEAGYSRMKSNAQMEPFAADNSDFFLSDDIVSPGVQVGNPFLPAAIRDYMVANDIDSISLRKRMNGVFDRNNQNDRDFYRGVIGLRGDFDNGWSWDVYYNQSRTKESTESGTALRDRLYYAIDAVSGPNGPMCRDVAARAAGCVPFNPFGFDSVSRESANYITAGGLKDTYEATIKQQVVAANVTGPVLEMAAGQLQVAAGVEYRKEESEEVYSEFTQQGLSLGNALDNSIGDYDVKEAYVEAIVPLLADATFARSLDFEAAVRLGDYSTVGEVTSWKSGLTWAPVDDVRFRAVYSSATRAPNIGELRAGPVEDYFGRLSDPCNGTTAADTGAVADYCRSIPGIAQQIAANGSFLYDRGLNQDTDSIRGFNQSNPSLHEEVAKTWTVGVVLTPQALPHFQLTVDWFQIKIDDAIKFAPRQFTIDECVNSLGTSPLCALITREAVDTPRERTPGTVYNVNAPQMNVASIETSGVDVAGSYAFQFDNAQELRVTLAYTYLDKLTLQRSPDARPTDNKGELDGEGRLGAGFEHRANLGLNYSIGRFSANWRINYLGPIKDTLDEHDPVLARGVNEIGSYAYHDMQLRYAFGGDEQYNVYFGADNVFDKKPPLLGQDAASVVIGTETAADTYDPFGRYYYAGVRVDF